MTDQAVAALNAEEIEARYEQERVKRLRADGNAQYVAMTGKYAHYMEDPFAHENPDISLDPVSIDTEVALIGAGFGNLQAAVELQKQGIEDFILFDRASDFGGVWYWNRYPGVACDVDSYIYMPMLEETGYMPTRKYATGREIFEYAKLMGRHFDLYKRALFRREIADIRWNDEEARWYVTTNRGDVVRARFVHLATGPLQLPRLPGIPGIEGFKGHSFHTSRWDYEYTGGNADGGLEGLRDKRVGIIGTGATAVQAIPFLGQYAKQLYVFQRTPAMVPVRNHMDTDPEWAKSLKPGWQQERMDNFNILVSGGRQDVDLVDDGWTEVLHRVGIETDRMSDEAAAEKQRLADLEYMEGLRNRVDALVEDKETAEKLKPWYHANCKRPCFHDDYLQTFNRPNVTLVDTDGKGVERVTENAVIVDGKEYEVDCLIYATGFEFNTADMSARNGFEVYGRGGRSWSQKWKEDGISTYYGYTMRGFPNLVVEGNAQGTLSANITHALGEGAKHLAYLVRQSKDRQWSSIEPSEDAERKYVDFVHKTTYRIKHDERCTPGYYNNEGKVDEGTGIAQFYPGSPHVFFQKMGEWRAKGDLEGMDLIPAP